MCECTASYGKAVSPESPQNSGWASCSTWGWKSTNTTKQQRQCWYRSEGPTIKERSCRKAKPNHKQMLTTMMAELKPLASTSRVKLCATTSRQCSPTISSNDTMTHFMHLAKVVSIHCISTRQWKEGQDKVHKRNADQFENGNLSVPPKSEVPKGNVMRSYRRCGDWDTIPMWEMELSRNTRLVSTSTDQRWVTV